ncbi:flagellar assembly protein FliW [Desulfoplanes formicivorans]|uniref:Flagellar assembly factor FliW n=1 Tax=Desulfoplanes formicivorans TaxID=1592317 RepID=A0A194AHR9_9BACT|nr:flagellar assembly protein FliW [Desulfoplanes formicivorans]GAU09627.1 flagellar assembly protein FliW [Desulfoplanes formicivorans]
METKTQQIILSRLGEKQIDLNKVIAFPRGLFGFESSRRFILCRIRQDSPFLMLQDVDNSALGLIVTDPFDFVPDYSLKVEDCDADVLGTSNVDEISVIVTVSIPHGEPEKTSLNLCGPILINTSTRVGVQAPQLDPACKSVLLRDL